MNGPWRENPICREIEFVLKIIAAPFYYMGYCLCCPCCFIYQSPVGCGTMSRRKAQQKLVENSRRRRHRREPKKLPRRRRALSTTPEARPRNDQDLPPLLRLSFEIREQIFFEVLGNSVIHLTQRKKRLGHIRCDGSCPAPSPTPRGGPLSRSCFPEGKQKWYHHSQLAKIQDERHEFSDSCLALLRTCRQVYREAVEVLYRSNTFEVNHPQTLIFLARTIRAQRLEAIKNLQITWHNPARFWFAGGYDRKPDDMETWNKMWGVIGKDMKGLRSVKLTMDMVDDPLRNAISDCRCEPSAYLDMMLESPKMELKGLRKFELEVPTGWWDVTEVEKEMRTTVCESTEI